MSKFKIAATPREVVGKKVKNLRSEGKTPVSLYGPDQESINAAVSAKELNKLYDQVGHTSLIDVELEGEKKPFVCLIKEVQSDPVSAEILHVGMYVVSDKKQISVRVPINFVGTSPAVRKNVGFLTTPLAEVLVRCLPKDLPAELEIDISGLAEIGDLLKVSDIALPAGVELHSSVSEFATIARINPPQKQLVVEEETEDDEESDQDAEGEEGVEGDDEADAESESEKQG